MTNDCVHILCRKDLRCGRDHMRQQRLAANLVQDFGAPGFKPGTFAGGHDHNGQMMGTVLLLIGH